MTRERNGGAARDDGSALFIGVVMLLILASLAAAYLTVSVARYRDTLSRRDSLQSRYVAEAGLDTALVSLNNQALTFVGGVAKFSSSLGGNDYDVVVVDLGNDVFRVTSSGEANGYRREMEVVARREFPPFMEYAIVTDGNLDIRGSITVKGDIHSNQWIDMQGPGIITGNASAVGDITMGVGSKGGVGGDVLPFSDYVPIPQINIKALRDEAIASGDYYKTSQTWAPKATKVAGLTFVEGDLHLSGQLTGKGIIVCSGDLDITGRVTLADPANDTVFLISGGDAFIRGNPSAHQAFIYANGAAKLRGNVDIEGILVAREGLADDGDTSIKGHLGFTYMPVAEDFWSRFATYRTVVRRELE
ncbi:MAG: hypothetical protein JW909_03435 [Planctomycetes bacterium]|nr:hypothetical protein [Planctomycetota bacterium]